MFGFLDYCLYYWAKVSMKHIATCTANTARRLRQTERRYNFTVKIKNAPARPDGDRGMKREGIETDVMHYTTTIKYMSKEQSSGGGIAVAVARIEACGIQPDLIC